MEKEGFFNQKIRIPEWEMDFRADRSSGPGGQNVNKTATKITLRFKIKASKNLTDEQKNKLFNLLANNINKEDEIVISEQSSRSQYTNKMEAVKKLNDMINKALKPKLERKETKEPEYVKEGLIASKKKRSEIKKGRGKVEWD
jgi:ribosome-associated protein